MSKSIKPGQLVAFSQAVLKRCGGDKSIADMRAIVLSLMSNGKVAQVDTRGTYPNEDGNSVRYIPVANLTVVLRNGAVFGD